MKLARILTLTLVALVLALAAGCGGGDDEEEPAAPSGDATEQADSAAAKAITVTLDEYSFDPENAVVARNGTITADNKGSAPHNLTIEQGPDPKEKTKKLAATSTFVGGRSEELEIDLEAGKYAMVCTVQGHRELGMTGTLEVK
jgi:plastocyanin